ncbi:MAG: hypothetical protein HOG95_09540 [Rhodospirillaceae bacterium]|jgi:hypothetical protein|nr:hypothetical protein [Rhodospirillaceae bacterium]MBT4590112.1 hypothetical protein [Rhodospirillaceae bacterium]MBT5940164.1 hypothetical protein [Rhodospirillaceae bacterium]MBT7266546.1 hypothetical protein [Rhodospirillaceae bacterium]
MNYQEIDHRIAQADMRCCGGFHPGPSDDFSATTKTVLIVGNAGNRKTSNFWPSFETNRPENTNPLESWTRDVLTNIARDLKAEVIFPFDGPPYIPILTWAQKVEPVNPSPFGAFIHPNFGLWHAYRGVLLLDEKIDLPKIKTPPSPCETCPDQPCLSTCPVGAIKDGDFNVEACVGFLAKPKGQVCMGQGCLARRACPVGQEHVYEPAQAEFHLQAFLETFGPK